VNSADEVRAADRAVANGMSAANAHQHANEQRMHASSMKPGYEFNEDAMSPSDGAVDWTGSG
jgi:hypothetical protein